MHTPSNSNGLTTIHVLAIDDEPAILETYKTLLGLAVPENEKIPELDALATLVQGDETGNLEFNPSDYTIVLDTTTDGATAVEMVQRSQSEENPYQVAIVDYRMPQGLNGLETVHEMRQLDPEINIIFVSAYMDGPLEALRRELGAKFSLLRKPFDEEELYQQVLLMGASWSQQSNLSRLLTIEQQSSMELEQSYRLMERERKFSASLTHSMKDGVYALDVDGKLTFLNEAAERLLGWKYSELMGQDFHQLVHPHDPEQEDYVPIERCPLFVYPARGETYSDTVWLRCSNNHLVPVEITTSPLKSPSGKVAGSVAVFHDISARIELDESLRQAVNKAREESLKVKKAAQAKDDFLASMSHELRTPLTAIIGYCDVLRDQLTNSEQRESLDCIRAAGENQLSLVNDILDMSKIESGKFTIEESRYSIQGLLKEIEQMLSLRIQDKGLEFKIDQYSESHMLCGDPQRIKQILINLIGNAIKFTEHGMITLTSSQSDEKLQFSVEDTGIGIRPENLVKLFKRFEQEDSSISGRFGGSGLGLYISKSLAEMMGGDLVVSSKFGKGSIFTLTLPYRPTAEHDTSANYRDTHGEAINVSLFSGKVLLVEDTDILQLLIRRMLEKLGIVVVLAENGQEAVDRVEQEQFDLILMDMQMPVMDGIEATRRIRAKGVITPLYGLTANVMKRHRDAFAEAGSDGLIAKPIDKMELGKILNQNLKSV